MSSNTKDPEPTSAGSASNDSANSSASTNPVRVFAARMSALFPSGDTIFNIMKKCRIVIVIFWIIAVGASVYWAPQLFSATSSSFDPPSGSYAEKANNIYKEFFGDADAEPDIIVVMIEKVSEGVLNDDFAATITYSLYTDLMTNYPDDIVQISGYYLLLNTNYALMAPNYMSDSGQSTIISVSSVVDTGSKIGRHLRKVLKDLPTTDSVGGEYEYCVTGSPLLNYDEDEGITADMERTDGVALPIAIIILACVVRSSTMIIIPLINFICSVIIAFAVMYPIAKWPAQVPSWAPSVMLSFGIAMSIDYSLFLLTRYVEELQKGQENEEAVKQTVLNAGKIVLTSGTVIIVCLAFLLCFPLSFIRSFGLSAAFTLVFAVCSNMTLTPSLLLLFGKVWFSKPLPCFKKGRKYHIVTDAEARQKELSSWLYKFTAKITEPAWGILVLVSATVFIVPIAQFVRGLDISQNNAMIIPKGSEANKALKELGTQFPIGMLEPYYVIGVADDMTQSIWTPEYFAASQLLAQTLAENVGGIEYDDIISFTDLTGMQVPFWYANYLLSTNTSLEAYSYQAIVSQYLATSTQGALIEVHTLFNPEKYTDLVSAQTNFSFYVYSWNSDFYDGVNKTFDLFPLILACMAIAVLILLAIAFQSLVIPVIAVITIALTLVWIFGFAAFGFCFGYFDPADGDGEYWFSVITTFPVIVGLCLDYDVFLLARISEFRKEGWDTRSSVVKATQRILWVIMWAGIIMFIAFGALLFSSIHTLLQIGYNLAFSVLLDTFLMCTFLVPVLIVFSREVTWWPCKYPTLRTDRMPKLSSLGWLSSTLQSKYMTFITWSTWTPAPTEPALEGEEEEDIEDHERGIPMTKFTLYSLQKGDTLE